MGRGVSEGLPILPGSLAYKAYVAGLISGEFDGKTQAEIGKILSISDRSLRGWNRKLDWEHIRDERRKKYARHMVPVDAALFKAACDGDTAAIKLAYERFDGYVPQSIQRQIHEIDEFEIDQELDALAERKRAVLKTLRDTNAADEPVDGAGREAPAGVGATPPLPAAA